MARSFARTLARACALPASVFSAAVFLAAAFPAPLAAAQDDKLAAIPTVPRALQPATTSWGDPDLRRSWPIDHLTFTPFQRPMAQDDRHSLHDEAFAPHAAKPGQHGQADDGQNGQSGRYISSSRAQRGLNQD